MFDPNYETRHMFAVGKLRSNLQAMEEDPDRDQLTGMSPDSAYELGYRAAIMDFSRIMDPEQDV